MRSQLAESISFRRGRLPIIALGVFVIGSLLLWRPLSQLLPHLEPRYEGISLPLRTLRISPDLSLADALPAQPGDLRGASLLLITLDTTRPDRIGLYGNGEIRTPVLDGLARDGVVFSSALATAPTTLPAHASILTGLQPHRHGARANGVYRLADSQDTLAEVLVARGYTTAAFVSSFVLDAVSGVAQGFEVYDAETADKASSLGDPERRGDETTERALRWLREERGREPFFLWVHYFDPHADQKPPPPYAEEYAHMPYDGEIAFVDAQIGKLLEALPPREASDTLIVVVGDHGDGHGHHGETSHGPLLHEAVLRVPLIMYASGVLDGGIHLTRPVSQVDLMPTVLSLLDIEYPRALDGIDLTQAPVGDRAIFAETIHGLVSYGWAPLAAVYRGNLKYVYGPRPELYDLASDPLETHNLYAEDPARAVPLHAALERELGPDIDSTLEPPIAHIPQADEIEKLRALGYIVDRPHSSVPTGQRPDPTRMQPVLAEIQYLMSGIPMPEPWPLRSLRWLAGISVPRTLDERVARMDEICREHPDFAVALRYLALLQDENHQLLEAEQTLLRAIRLLPNSALEPHLRAGILIRLGRPAEAREVLVDLVGRHPSFVPARSHLGRLLLQQGRPSEAADHLLRAWELEPDPELRRTLIQALRSAGRKAELRTLRRGKK